MLYRRGHEMASHSITHRMPQRWWANEATQVDWEFEIDGERRNLVELGGVNENHVTGVRAPYLDTGGDVQFTMMREKGFRYDASFMTGPHAGGGLWPFTLDFAPTSTHCDNINCPQSAFPGLWEVPLNRWLDSDGNKCAMVDSCTKQVYTHMYSCTHALRRFKQMLLCTN